MNSRFGAGDPLVWGWEWKRRGGRGGAAVPEACPSAVALTTALEHSSVPQSRRQHRSTPHPPYSPAHPPTDLTAPLLPLSLPVLGAASGSRAVTAGSDRGKRRGPSRSCPGRAPWPGPHTPAGGKGGGEHLQGDEGELRSQEVRSPRTLQAPEPPSSPAAETPTMCSSLPPPPPLSSSPPCPPHHLQQLVFGPSPPLPPHTHPNPPHHLQQLVHVPHRLVHGGALNDTAAQVQVVLGQVAARGGGLGLGLTRDKSTHHLGIPEEAIQPPPPAPPRPSRHRSPPHTHTTHT